MQGRCKRFYQVAALGLLSIGANCVQAAMPTFEPQVNYRPAYYAYAVFFAGFNKVGKTQTVAVDLNVTNRYETTRDSVSHFILGGGGGIQIPTESDLSYYVGVSGFQFDRETVRGLVRPMFDVMPNFDTLDFEYEVRSTPLYAEVFVEANRHLISTYFHPYVLGGIGVSINKTKNYREVPTDPTSASCPAAMVFRNNRNTAFALEIGTGINVAVAQHAKLAIEYRFMHLGEGSLGTPATSRLGGEMLTGLLDAQIIGITLTLVS